jgi:hypothetical protein
MADDLEDSLFALGRSDLACQDPADPKVLGSTLFLGNESIGRLLHPVMQVGISRIALPVARMYASAIFATSSRLRDAAGITRSRRQQTEKRRPPRG